MIPKKFYKELSFFLFFLISAITCHSQAADTNSPASSRFNAGLITASYSFDIPFSDLAKRFGFNSEVGCGFYYKFKNNWMAGVEGTFLFGETVNESGILDSISTNEKFIIGTDGYFANIQMFERGFRLPMVRIGKVFSLPKKFPNSGILIHPT